MPHPMFFFTAISPEFFESLDLYRPSRELLDLVERFCGEGWNLSPGGFWSNCAPDGYKPAIQGWKIHVAGTVPTAIELLRRLVPLFAEEGVPFKFCSDLTMTRLSTSKNWDRTGAGKFITVYPKDIDQFKTLVESCHQATSDLSGPYILTDRPYRDSRVIFYRYGGHLAVFRTDPQGRRIPVIFTPEGNEFFDQRVPFFRIPPWISDPFGHVPQQKTSQELQQLSLQKGRYQIKRAIRYSSAGGIYEAIDNKTGEAVVIREQRPMLGDGAKGLEKEARILKKLGDTGVTPRFVDLFDEAKHSFLVQERLFADSLWTRTMVFMFGKPTPPTPEELFRLIRETVRKVIQALEVVHAHHVILRDFTKTNVLFTTQDDHVKLIDFELAYETDRNDPPITGFTIGYASPQQLRNQAPEPSDDFYALGALLVDAISVTASGLGLHRSGVLTSLKQTLDDLGLPQDLSNVAEGLLEEDPERRLFPREVMRKLDSASLPRVSRILDPLVLPGFAECPPRSAPDKALAETIRETQNGITKYLLATANYTRRDRLWPASPEVFVSNPVCIRFGAAGIAYYLWRVNRAVPDRVIQWIVDLSSPQICHPALYSGLSGVAMLLVDLGLIDQAKRMLELSNDRERVYQVPGLYEGAAGWGLVNLHFWCSTGEHEYLGRAVEVAEHLMGSAKVDKSGAFWESGETVPLGLGSGPSGIALFFLYLNAIHSDTKFLSMARNAVSFEIANAYWVGDRVFMHEIRTIDPKKMRSPHTKYGSAGVGSAALRLYAVTGEEKFRKFAEKCTYTVSTRLTNKLWQDWGLSGFGELLIDAFVFLGDNNYLNTAYYLAEGILPYRILKPEGIAFPGGELLRISCDYGLGSAGIGMFFHRLLNPTTPRFLLLDELLLSARGLSARSPDIQMGSATSGGIEVA